MRRRCGDCRRDRKLNDDGRCRECQLRHGDGTGDESGQHYGLEPLVVEYLKLAALGANRGQAAALMGVDVVEVELALSRLDAAGRGRTAAGTPAVEGLPSAPAPGYVNPDAACRGEEPSLFFGVNGERKGAARDRREAEAKAVCRRCPVVDACLEWALDSADSGVWGAMTPEERATERRHRAARAAMNATLPCGTRSARLRHLAQGRTCETCGVGYEPLSAVEPLERVEEAA